MKIVFLTDAIPPESPGGAGFSTFILAKGIKDLGNEILIISGTNDKKKDKKREFYQGIEIFYIYVNYNRKLRTYYGLYNPKVIAILKKILAEYKPDVIHAHNLINRISFYSLIIAKKNARAVFFTARDTMSFTYGKFWWYINKNYSEIQKNFDYRVREVDLIKQYKKSYFPLRNYLIRKWINRCNLVFAVSNELKKALKQNKIKNVETVYNSVITEEYDKIGKNEIERFKKGYKLENRKIIFCAGRLDGLKGLTQTLRALLEIKKYYPDILLTLAMKEHYFQPIQKLINSLGIKNNILCYGWLDSEKIKIAYKVSDVCVVPSICFDSFPRVNLEAMAAKKPVIGTCFGGTLEVVVDGVTGYVVNPFNIKMMSEKILDLLDNPPKAQQFGEAGYERVKNDFNVEFHVKRTLDFYSNFLKIEN